MNAARRIPTTPIRLGHTWLFSDGSRLPVVGGADDDSTAPVVPEDLTAIDDAELADLESALSSYFDELLDAGSTDLAHMTEVAEAIERVRIESTTREQTAAETAEQIAALAARVHASDDGPEGDDDDGDDPGEGAPADADDPEGAAVEPEREVVTAAAPRPAPARRPASASGTTRRAGRPSVPEAQARVTITAAADLAGIPVNANIDMTQVAIAMHDKARSLSNHGKAPIARFNLPYPAAQRIGERTSAEAALAIMDDAANPASLLAAGGWCTPSQNMYDLLALDGATGLLDVPSVGVDRGGINVPSYIGIDAADGALWSWTEDQDEGTALTITDLDASAGTATFSTSAAHLLALGDTVVIAVGNPAVDGPQVINGVTDADTATFATTGTPTVTNATGFATRQKGCYSIPCPTWTDVRLAAYGLCLKHGNLTDRAFPELTRRYLALVMNAHLHRMSAVNIAKIQAASTAVTVTAAGTDSFGELMSAIELQAVDYRSTHQISGNAVLEVLLPSWTREMLRANLAMRAGVDTMLSVSNAQIDAHFNARNVRTQFLEDFLPISTGTPLQAWPSTVRFLMYPAGGFVEGRGGSIDLGVTRDSRLNATNDFTAAWTEDFSLLARRGPLGRNATVTLTTDGITACCP